MKEKGRKDIGKDKEEDETTPPKPRKSRVKKMVRVMTKDEIQYALNKRKELEAKMVQIEVPKRALKDQRRLVAEAEAALKQVK